MISNIVLYLLKKANV